MDPDGHAPPRRPIWGILATVAVGLWIVGLSVLSQVARYVIDLVSAVYDGRLAPGTTIVTIAVVAALLIIGPAALLGWLPASPGVRAVGRTWAMAGAAFAGLSAAGLVPVEQHELYLGVLAGSAAIVARLVRRRAEAPPAHPAARLAALAGGVAVLAPWAWIGALGGITETVLAAVAAATVGWLAAGLLAHVGFEGTLARRVILTGLVHGVALAPIAAATGGTGVSVAALVVLPPLGFAAAALRRGTGLLIGLAAAGPLAFVDPEETTALLGTSDVGYWTLIAAAAAFGVALVVDVTVAATLARGLPLTRRPVALVTAALVAGTAAGYATVGQPGLHGERLFVVMAAQADLGGVEAIADRAERLRETYRRLVDTAERTQAPLRKDLHRLRVGFRPFYLVNGLEVDGGPAVRAWLARRAEVDRVLLNPTLRPIPEPPRPLRGGPAAGPLWNIDAVRAPRVWSELGVRGAGIVIGTSDSGVDGSHPALAGSFRGGDDSWYDPWNGTRTPVDRNGHGTHTLGSALGADGIGVAPAATWIGCVDLDRNLGNPARYLDCLQFMLAPFPPGGDPLRDGRPERAPHVLTNSWGCPPLEGCDRRVLGPAVAALSAAGLFFVAAAGNSGPRCGSITEEPAIDPGAFTVGAVDDQRRLADFSSRGPVPGAAAPEPDLVAPGVRIRSALPGGGYGELDGTSMATPHVAGVVALMWSASPRLIGDVRHTAEILRATAGAADGSGNQDCGGERNLIGAGLVDAYAAVQVASAG
jgi:hypothetical protein